MGDFDEDATDIPAAQEKVEEDEDEEDLEADLIYGNTAKAKMNRSKRQTWKKWRKDGKISQEKLEEYDAIGPPNALQKRIAFIDEFFEKDDKDVKFEYKFDQI